MTSRVQSVLFDKTKWSMTGAVEWLRRHHFKIQKVDTTPNYYRFRQFDPTTFRYYRTIVKQERGISFIIEY